MMRPRNAAEDVQQFCLLLGLDPEDTFLLQPTNNTPGIPVFLWDS